MSGAGTGVETVGGAGALAPRPVFVGAPRDAVGAPLAAGAADSLYAGARAAHAHLSGSLDLETSADPVRLDRAIERWALQKVRTARGHRARNALTIRSSGARCGPAEAIASATPRPESNEPGNR